MALVESVPIEGFKVYGIQQSDYTVKGVPNCDYAKAVSVAMFQETGAIETETNAYAAVLKARQKKLEELGWALSVIVEALASMESESQKSTDLSVHDPDLATAAGILNKYRRESNNEMILELNLEDGEVRVARESATKAQSALQYEIDFETNEMQQDMVTMQSLVSKRDNSFSTAAALIEKSNSTADAIIGNME